jgi:hypothetical protein
MRRRRGPGFSRSPNWGRADRMRVEVGGKYIPVPDLQNLGAMGEIHSHFDRRIISQGTGCSLSARWEWSYPSLGKTQPPGKLCRCWPSFRTHQRG